MTHDRGLALFPTALVLGEHAMLWRGREESQNVEDRRGMGRGGLVIGGGAGTIVLALVWMLLGGDPRAILNQTQAV